MNAQVEPKQERDVEPNFQLLIKDFQQFYRFYLTEHRNIMSRRLHVTGSSMGLYFFSKAILKQPVYSFISDWRMFFDVLRGNLSLQDRTLDKIPSE